MVKKDTQSSGASISSDREQRYQVLSKLLEWTAEEFHDLGHRESADVILSIREKIEAKIGR